jgi:hypothetical protein
MGETGLCLTSCFLQSFLDLKFKFKHYFIGGYFPFEVSSILCMKVFTISFEMCNY